MYRTFGTTEKRGVASSPQQEKETSMSRVNTPRSIEEAPKASQALLKAVQAKFGAVPNMFRLASSSPAALEGLLGLWTGIEKSPLGPAFMEGAALTVANVNGCSYCNSAHSYIGSKVAKLPDKEIALNREGRSGDAKTDAGLRFARKVAVNRGEISEDDLQAARRAGFTDAELIDIVGFVALNVFTNYLNETFKTDIDFPLAEARRAA
jgi:uncharacterized peroxidase-related enzyme